MSATATLVRVTKNDHPAAHVTHIEGITIREVLVKSGAGLPGESESVYVNDVLTTDLDRPLMTDADIQVLEMLANG